MTKLRSKQSHGHAPLVHKRPGEHYFVDVHIEQNVSTSGETVTSIGLALDEAPVPDRRYVADSCYVTHDEAGVKLVFGQRKLVGNQLRSAVVVKMSRRGVANLLAAANAIRNPSYAEIAAHEGFTPISVQPVPAEPDQVITLWANLALTAMSGEESSIDFLQLSPFAMAAMAKGARQAAIDPIVRIDLSSEMFLGLLDGLRRVPGLKMDLIEATT